jgi:hypothetical protein
VGSKVEYNVVSKTKITGLTDVVVVGYGRQKKPRWAQWLRLLDEKMTGRPAPQYFFRFGGLVKV